MGDGDVAATEVRNDKGQFVEGVSGNPKGRPKGRKNQLTELKQDLEIAVRSKMSGAKVQNIVNKMCELAEEGNVGAAKLILDKVITNARDTDDVGGQDGGWTFVIKNVTVQREENNSPDAVEGEFTEVTPEEA